MTSGVLIPDIMHDILEGALPLELKLVLKVAMCGTHTLHIHAYTQCHVYINRTHTCTHNTQLHTCKRVGTSDRAAAAYLQGHRREHRGTQFDGDKPSPLSRVSPNLHQHGVLRYNL